MLQEHLYTMRSFEKNIQGGLAADHHFGDTFLLCSPGSILVEYYSLSTPSHFLCEKKAYSNVLVLASNSIFRGGNIYLVFPFCTSS